MTTSIALLRTAICATLTVPVAKDERIHAEAYGTADEIRVAREADRAATDTAARALLAVWRRMSLRGRRRREF